MKTLIVHPKDRTTTFLEVVYKSIENKTVITGGIDKDELRKLIKEHDRVMMMGHGSPSGLFSVGQFKNVGLIIDNSVVDLLSEKNNSVFIWCNADKFVNQYKLKGFYSGMFISEVGEAYVCGVKEVSQKIVDESNHGFCKILSEHIMEDKSVIYEEVMFKYGIIAENNPVAKYNHQRLYKS